MATVATLTDTTIVGDNEEQLVTMIVDNQLFGVPILQVQDIVEASRITPVPLAPSAIAGVLNLRGRIVTVIDLRKIMGNNDEVPWESQMGVTVEHKGDLYTLLVDAIGDVRTLPKRDFDSAPSTMEQKIRQLCSGIFRLRGNLLVVLDVSRILDPAVIESTAKISVDERRARKLEAMEKNKDTKAEGGRQLSALMTDLNAYEKDFDSGLDSLSGDSDDIKARKKANRSRRAVGERWREVLAEKARKEGTTVYRMREPDEETLEEAREREKKTQEEWEAEWQARQQGTYVPRIDESEDEDVADASGLELSAPDMPAPDMAADMPPAVEDDASHGVGSVVSDWWNKMRGKPGDAQDKSEPPVTEDFAAPETPMAEEIPAEFPPEEPAAEAAPVEEADAGDTDNASDDDKKAAKGSAKGKSSGKSKKKK